jgi:tRNA nucleotidyltransferase (CCA-adding enzyme)
VIRCVRFASRFDLSIEPDVAEAIRNAEITAALRTKVSKERIGIEITKMIQKTPYSALTLITQLGLQPAVFTCPGLDSDPPRDEVEPHCEILHHLPEHGHEVHPYHWFAAATTPFQGKTVKVKKEVPAVAHVISEGLKVDLARLCRHR